MRFIILIFCIQIILLSNSLHLKKTGHFSTESTSFKEKLLALRKRINSVRNELQDIQSELSNPKNLRILHELMQNCSETKLIKNNTNITRDVLPLISFEEIESNIKNEKNEISEKNEKSEKNERKEKFFEEPLKMQLKEEEEDKKEVFSISGNENNENSFVKLSFFENSIFDNLT